MTCRAYIYSDDVRIHPNYRQPQHVVTQSFECYNARTIFKAESDLCFLMIQEQDTQEKKLKGRVGLVNIFDPDCSTGRYMVEVTKTLSNVSTKAEKRKKKKKTASNVPIFSDYLLLCTKTRQDKCT